MSIFAKYPDQGEINTKGGAQEIWVSLFSIGDSRFSQIVLDGFVCFKITGGSPTAYDPIEKEDWGAGDEGPSSSDITEEEVAGIFRYAMLRNRLAESGQLMVFKTLEPVTRKEVEDSLSAFNKEEIQSLEKWLSADHYLQDAPAY